MLSRRVLLAGVGAATAGLAGCALVPPGPVPTPTPTATPDAAATAFLRLHEALVAAHAADHDEARLALLGWAADVSVEQGAAIGWPVAPPAPRTPTPSPSPTPTPSDAATPAPIDGTPPPATPVAPEPPAPVPPEVLALPGVIAEVLPHYRARALDAATSQPLVWAAMRAWASALAAAFDHPSRPVEAKRDRLPPPVQTVAEASQAAASTVVEALYAIETAGGTPGISPDELTHVRARVVFWRQLRDDLRGTLGPSPSASPTPGPPWYHVPRPADPAAASALVARVQAAALPILGRSLAFGSDALRALLTDAVANLAADQPTWGAPMLRWPGWPDAVAER